MKSEEVLPQGFYVLAEVTKLPSIQDGVYTGEAQGSGQIEQSFYKGTALKLGGKATEECPELKEGDHIIFADIAGVQVATEDNYCKVIRGSNVVAITTDLENMNKETIKPTKDRILVEIVEEGLINKDGVYDDSSDDPRDAVTQKGRVISCAAEADQYDEGTIVYFDPYCGNIILDDGTKKLKTVNSFDIFFSISK